MFRAMCGVCIALTAAAVAGCGSSREETHSVSGSVTLDGKPLADGNVYFVTVAKGDMEAVPIAGGRFEGRVKAGSRRVEIRAYRAAEAPPAEPGAPPPPEAPMENYLPGRYNTESTLTAEVKESGANEFTFTLTSEPDPPREDNP